MNPKVLRRERKLALHCVGLLSSYSTFGSSRKLADYFVTDDKDLCLFAYERGSLTKLSQVVNSITPTDKPLTWEEEESEHISSLREASLFMILAPLLSTHWNCNRQLSAQLQPYRCGITIFVGRSLRTTL
jgi:hypothetical protein